MILGTCYAGARPRWQCFSVYHNVDNLRIISVKYFQAVLFAILFDLFLPSCLSKHRSHVLPCKHDKVIFPRDKMFKVGDLRSKWAELLFEMSASDFTWWLYQVALPAEVTVSSWEMIGHNYDAPSLRLADLFVCLFVCLLFICSMWLRLPGQL